MADLKTSRLRKFLTQRQSADVVRVQYQTVQCWESGQSAPRPNHMANFAEVTGVVGTAFVDAINAERETSQSKTEAA
ncbi:MAG: helix-turn-helix transcriptional regulator [Chloroflexi bacterium]|nr:helix-turn-helix transcriptional regulator [Chloroflexota bacterium]